MFNYLVDPEILKPFVPAGTRLDLWNNKCFISVVGFYFTNTRLKGIRIPFHVHFEEVNLRFYVKRAVGEEERRGVVFIKEIVSKPLLVLVANWVYKENYGRHPMRYSWNLGSDQQTIEYAWHCKGKWNSIQVEAETRPVDISVGSEAEFITEHYWGYARKNAQSTVEYEVTHPRWQQYPVVQAHIDVDFASTYGEGFGFLSAQQAHSVFLAEGSSITVEPAETFINVV